MLTGPMLFVCAGILIEALAGVKHLQLDRKMFLSLAEIGLSMLLFADASRTDLRVLHSINNLPTRLLSSGMLLTIVLGAVLAKIVLPQLSIWEAGVLSAILAPTDAGLGQIIVNSPRLPLRIRQALNVEAGLNDGMAVPFMMFFIALAATKAEGPAAILLRFIWEQLGLGLLVGLAVGGIGGWLLARAERRRTIADSYRQLAVVMLPLLCIIVCEEAGASMFIAAFVAGLAVQICYAGAGAHSVEFTEGWGQILNLGVFYLFGLFVPQAWSQVGAALLLYAVLSLTVVRMFPVAVSLVGSGLSTSTIMFMGWFGPRGLASIVLGTVYLEQQANLPGEPIIRLAVILTVLTSIFAHGLSALPGIEIYRKSLSKLSTAAPEVQGCG